MNQGHREGYAKEFSNILHAQFVTEDLVHEGKLILVDVEVTVECSLLGLFAGLVVELHQESDVQIQILRFSVKDFSV